MNPLIESHREQLRSIAARYGIERVRVFGSMARDDADTDSDIDLLVSLPPGTSGLALGSLLMDVQDLMQRKVDVVTEAGLHPAVREGILREATLL
ncbi:nucleotidyltransferase family protein [Candidatus Thiodictyon syntrophicum]|jgi:hypothetical protein|uniref:Nucleotidyltransferase n=1 Tax=Candidatus Thiodictyon syntrophicum TaxID=1166950 RepID=A0A2K8U9E9_9GAMM|nr:nucleotidyltransferase domain-containing protein [Candidatus Thiodictyon syntrophicum]AUB82167.1 nucleotidyltransferase [Candidatus Thiodictyon syntrophicum]